MTRRRILTCLGLILVTASGCTSPVIDLVANRTFLPNEGIREGTYGTRTERRVGFTTRDGVELLADVHHPRGPEKTPTILVRIPFTNTFGNRLRSDIVGRYWARRGYTVVIQGTRGRYESGGTFYPLMHERGDGLETLAWLEEQPWYDGRLATWGGSAFGHTQWAIADQADPGPNAVFIQIASSSFRQMFHPGGAFSLESALFWAVGSRGQGDRPVDFDDMERGFRGFPVIEADDRAIGDTPFFNDWLIHGELDGYWREIDGEERPRTLRAPALLLAGWYDPFLPTQVDDFTRILLEGRPEVAAETRLIIGPWSHAREIDLPGSSQELPYRRESIAPSIPWFDHQLGIATRTEAGMPRVRIYVMGENRWRDEDEWPLARIRYTDFYLHSAGSANSASGDGRLSAVAPVSSEPADAYIYDPERPVPSSGGAVLGPRAGIKLQNEVEARDDVLVYTTEALAQELEVTGPVRVILFVSTTSPATDFTAKLVDVHPDGSAYNLCDGILRAKYTPGQETEITIDLWPTSSVFLPGHRIRLEVSSSNYPRYDRNPNTGGDIPTATHSQAASQTVAHSAKSPSRLILPVIPRETVGDVSSIATVF